MSLGVDDEAGVTEERDGRDGSGRGVVEDEVTGGGGGNEAARSLAKGTVHELSRGMLRGLLVVVVVVAAGGRDGSAGIHENGFEGCEADSAAVHEDEVPAAEVSGSGDAIVAGCVDGTANVSVLSRPVSVSGWKLLSKPGKTTGSTSGNVVILYDGAVGAADCASASALSVLPSAGSSKICRSRASFCLRFSR